MYICIYVYVYVYVYIKMYVYTRISISREKCGAEHNLLRGKIALNTFLSRKMLRWTHLFAENIVLRTSHVCENRLPAEYLRLRFTTGPYVLRRAGDAGARKVRDSRALGGGRAGGRGRAREARRETSMGGAWGVRGGGGGARDDGAWGCAGDAQVGAQRSAHLGEGAREGAQETRAGGTRRARGRWCAAFWHSR